MNSSWASISMISRARRGGALEHAEHRGCGARYLRARSRHAGSARRTAPRWHRAPLTDISSFGVRTRKRPAGSDATRSIASGGVSSVCSEVTRTARGPSLCTASIAASASRRVALLPRQQVELELVRRHDVGGRHRTVAHQLRDARPHEHAAPDVADHRIAAVARLAVRGLHLRGIEDRGAGLGRSLAGQHAVAPRQRIARRDPLHHLGDQRGVEHAPGPGAVAGGWRIARCGSATPPRRCAAAERWLPHCRHGRRRRGIGSRGCSRGKP